MAEKIVGRRARNVLTAAEVKAKRKPGLYADGGSLYLQVNSAGNRSWIFRYRSAAKGGKLAYLGLGSLTDVTLSQAREKAQKQREILGDNRDPLIERRKATAQLQVERDELIAEERRQRIADSTEKLFSEAALEFIEKKRPFWKNAKHADQWTNTLQTYAFPVIGDLSVNEIATPHLEQILAPIWNRKTETANRVRGRVEAVLDAATVMEYREGPNPARWKGHLEHLFDIDSDRKKHLAALPYDQIAAFVSELRTQNGVGPLALEFAILTAGRTGEVIGAQWGEIQDDVWVVPSSRMKAKREHRVPLVPRALEILQEVPRLEGAVFAGVRTGKPISNATMRKVLKVMGHTSITVHGFRSCFRDWAAETQSFPPMVAEMALAHTIPDKTERAYRRGDLFEKRRQLMESWSNYIETPQPVTDGGRNA